MASATSTDQRREGADEIAHRAVYALATTVGSWLDGVLPVLYDRQEHGEALSGERFKEVTDAVRAIHASIWDAVESLGRDL